MRVAFAAALIAFGADLEALSPLAYLLAASLDLEVASGLQHDWLFNADLSQNLLRADLLPYLRGVHAADPACAVLSGT